mgnify:CR=1 FL=1
MDHPTTVRCLLDVAGFVPPPEEVAHLEQAYALLTGMVASLYQVDAARYESPALTFDPQPQFADWA